MNAKKLQIKSRVILIGASGFIGKNLAQELEKNKISLVKITSKEIDLTEDQSIIQLQEIFLKDDIVVFLSAITPDKGNDTATYLKNIKMMEFLCSAIKNKSPGHLFYVSSDAVYSNKISIIDEWSECKPQDLYGQMHLIREEMGESICKSLKIPYTVLRPCAVYGVGDTHNGYGPNRFIREALKDSKITLFGHGEELRDHIYIEDVVQIILRIMAQREEGTFNIVTGKSESFFQVAERIASQMSEEVKIITQPRQKEIWNRNFTNSKIKNLFPDFKFSEMNKIFTKIIAQYRLRSQNL